MYIRISHQPALIVQVFCNYVMPMYRCAAVFKINLKNTAARRAQRRMRSILILHSFRNPDAKQCHGMFDHIGCQLA